MPKVYTWFDSSDFLITADWITRTVEQFQWTVDWSHGDKIIITYDKWLSAYHWITLAVKFPNNYFEFDDKKQSKLVWDAKMGILWIIWYIKDIFSNIEMSDTTIIILIFILIPIWIIVNKLKKLFENRFNLTYRLKWNFAKKYHTVIQYTPPKWLNSAEVWLLLHRNSNIKDLFSLIYKRAAEWLITINADINKSALWIKVINNIIVKKEKDIPDTYPEFEQKFFKLFIKKGGTNLACYDTNHLIDIKNLEQHWINQWWLKRKDNVGVIIFVLISLVILFVYPIFWILFVVVLCILFWWRLNKNLQETEKWAELIAYILWYKQFLAKCDEPVLKKFLAEDPLFFDKTLPYAVVFWLETEFLKKITPIMKEYNIQPKWYIWDFTNINQCISTTKSVWMQSTYTHNDGFSSWSSFWWGGWGFSGWWGWWGGWWWSW